MRKGLVSAFTEAGFTAVGVADYPAVLLRIDEFGPDIVVMDAALPGKDGFEACLELRSTFDIPVVLLGESPTDSVWERIMEVGADCYGVKPCGHLVLVARVKAILRRYTRSTRRLTPRSSDER